MTEVIMHEVNIGPTPPSGLSSVEVSKNSKGYTWSVKAYSEPGESLEETSARVKKVNFDLENTYRVP